MKSSRILQIDKPFLGVIIPVFNCETYVGQAIQSVCNQSCEDLIVVIVDDGSTDSSLQICCSLAKSDSRIRILHQENKGVSDARNRGMQYCIEAQVSYIAFLDADDVWCKGFYTQELKERMESGWTDLYEFGYYDGDKTLKKGRYHPITEKVRFCSHFCAFVYKMDIIKRCSIEFPVGKKVQEDCVFFYCFSSCIKDFVSFNNKDIFIYRSNPSSVLHKEFDATDRYFNHIIPAWEWAKCRMEDISSTVGKSSLKEISCCDTMKKTYLSEYIKIACEQGIAPKKIKKAIKEHEMDKYFLVDNEVWVDENSEMRYLNFWKRPYYIWIKYRVMGLLLKAGRIIKNIHIIRDKIYPLSLQEIW